MNRREFIKGAMAAVAASYVGVGAAKGTYTKYEGVSYRELTWRETWFDYNRYYGLEVEYINERNQKIRQGLRTMVSRFPIGERIHATDKMKDEMKKILFRWLNENVK